MRFTGRFTEWLRAVLTDQFGKRHPVRHFFPGEDAVVGTGRTLMDKDGEAHGTSRILTAEKVRPSLAQAFPIVGTLGATKWTAEDELHVFPVCLGGAA